MVPNLIGTRTIYNNLKSNVNNVTLPHTAILLLFIYIVASANCSIVRTTSKIILFVNESSSFLIGIQINFYSVKKRCKFYLALRTQPQHALLEQKDIDI
jgi:hypothetical protein